MTDREKKEFLGHMLESMEGAKREKLECVEVNDWMYFHSSLQQRLHDAVDYEERIEEKMKRRMIEGYVSKYK